MKESIFGDLPFKPVSPSKWKRTCEVVLNRNEAIRYFDPMTFQVLRVFGLITFAQGFVMGLGKTPIVIEDISESLILE